MKQVETVAKKSILNALNDLIDVVAKLRTPEEGCPWDLDQTQQSLVPYIIEEAYEVAAAIRSENQEEIVEELGDLLLQVVLQSQIASESQYFTLEEVAQGITDKLIRRHPHVFGDVQVENAQQVRKNWEEIKAKEKGYNPEQVEKLSQKFKKYTETLPPLFASLKGSQKAAQLGFEWETSQGVWEKFEEELSEFKQALETDDKNHQQSELGDVLFTLVNIARWYGLDPSEALQGTNQRFAQRLSVMENLADKSLSEYSLEELESLWQQAKQQLLSQSKTSETTEEKR
ncbi:MAG: nucleoside triphosphate pyrophosphohydrolase [Cyanobacteria bacterium SW_9_44_58]|nr:MAG: nucleoside triphosphate pyrophosphohydrolase [Cyanobacteria bacterium SW_9_44_58]